MLFALVFLLSFYQQTQAQLTISEDFNYGTSAGNLTGQNGGSGFAAAWTGGTGGYLPTGLSFGVLSSPGGAQSGSGFARQITTGFAASGPVSGSFLFQMTSASNSVEMLGLGTSASTNNQNHYIGLMPANDGQGGKPALGIRGTSISAMTGGASLTQGTTYMYAFSYDNGSTSAWILSLSQYTTFFNGTTLDQTAMNAAAIGTGSANVTGKATLSTSSSNLATMNYIYTYWFGGGSMTVDRIRMSGTAALSDLGPTEVSEIDMKGNSVSIPSGSTSPLTTNHTDFGAVTSGNSFARTFTIENTGTGSLAIGNITSDNSKFVVSNAPASVAANSTATFTVTFTPTSTGLETSTITVTNNDSDEGTYTFTVQAMTPFTLGFSCISGSIGNYYNGGAGPNVGVAFPNGTATSGGLNGTTNPIINVPSGFITGIAVTSTNLIGFRISVFDGLDNTGTQLGMREFVCNPCTGALSFTGTAKSVRLDRFSGPDLYDNLTFGSTTIGSALAETTVEINVKGNNNTIFDGTSSTSSTTDTDFGTVASGSSLAKTYTIENTGSGTMTINSITSGNAKFVVSNAPASVAGNSTATFTVTFSPTVSGVQNATITINNNDCDEAVYDFTVRGAANSVYTFNGTTNTDWATASNWSTNSVPATASLLSSDAVVIAANCAMNDVTISFPSGTSLTVNSGKTLTPSLNTSITIASGATLTVNATASLSQAHITNSGTMDIYGTYSSYYITNNSGGVMNVKSGGLYSCQACAQTFSAGSTINNDGTLYFGGGGNAGTINNNAGGMITDGVGGAQLANSGTINNAGTFTSRSSSTTGLFNNMGTFTMPISCNFSVNSGGSFSNTGSLTVPSGSIFNVNVSGTLTNNSAGTIVNNGTFAVNASGTLTNNGTYKGSGTYSTSLFTNPSGGIVAPGTSPGCHTFSNGYTNNGTLSIELGGTTACTQYDKITVTGTVTLSGTLDVSLINGYTGANGHQLTILSATALSGTFTTVNLPSNWYINYNLPAAGQVTLSYNAPLTLGAALDFDGANDYVSFPTTGMTATAGTLSFWMNAAATQAFINPVMIELGSENVAVFLWDNGSTLFFRAGGTGNQFSLPFTGTGSWKHIAMTWAGNGQPIKGYVDGVWVGTITMAGNTSFGSVGYLGRSSLYANGASNFKGSMDDIRIWNRTLCAEEISQLRNCEVSVTSDNLQLYFKGNQGAANSDNTTITTLIDDATLIGGANNGTLFNFGLTGSTSNFIATGGVTTGTNCPTVVFPEIDVKGNNVSIPDGTTATSTGNDTNFSNIAVNSSLTRTFTIDNTTGTADLTISSITSSNQTKFAVGNIPASVTAGSTAAFTVTFNPSATGTQTATITLNNNDCDEAVYDFAVTGNGVLPGAALSFDGTNNYVNCGNGSAFNPNNIKSLETWVKFTDLTNSQDIITKASTCSGTEMLIFGSNLAVYFMKDCNNFSHIDYPKSLLTAGQWYHIAVTWDGTKESIRMYINGAPVGTLSHTGDINATGLSDPTNGLYLGQWGLLDRPLNGVMDEVRVWSVTRSCDQINQLRNCELAGNEAGLLAYYKFNQGVAAGSNTALTSLTDATGNGNNGTFNGFAFTGSSSNFITPGGVTAGTSCTAVVAPEINVKGNSQDIVDGSPIPSTANHTDFNGTFTRTFTIQNTGNSVLTINNITSGNAGFVIGGAPTSVTAGGSATFTVTYNPTNATTQTSTITINNTDCDEAMYDFTVTATATAAKALHFDGVDDEVIANSTSSFFGTTPTTIEFWAKVNPGEGGVFIMDLGFTYQIGFNGTFGLSGFFLGGYNSGATVSADGNWAHYAVTYDGVNTFKAYKNGLPAPTPSCSACFSSYPAVTNAQLRVGVANNNYRFKGAIDEVRVWREERTAAQILANYNTEITSMPPCLDIYLKFNHGFVGAGNSTFTTATDAANTASANGTLNNFALTGTTSNWVAGSGITEVTSVYAPAPEANLKGTDNSTITDGTSTALSANGTGFGSVLVGNNLTRTFTFENTGNADLTVSSITSSNPVFTVSAISTTPIPAGTSATFTVTFTPTATGGQNATITVLNNDCDEANYNFAVSGTGSCIAPAFSACPVNQTVGTATDLCTAVVNYTATASGTPAPAITHVFTGATTGSGAGTGSGSVFNKGITTVTLIAANGCGNNATCSFTITVNDTQSPVVVCASNQTLTVASGSCTADYTIVDPLTDNCTGATWGYTLSGATTATVSGVADGTDSGVIPFNIGTTTVTLTATDGTNSATGCFFTVTVNAPEINVRGKGQDIADGETGTAEANDTDFGNAAGASIVKTFTIQNTGTTPLNINTITSSSPRFRVGSLSSASPVPAGGSATFTVTFYPNTTTAQTAILTIVNDDCNESIYDFAVAAVSSTVNANALDFDGVDDQIEATLNTRLFGTNSATVEFWAKGAPAFAFPINFDGVSLSVVWGPVLKMNVWFGAVFDTGYPIEDCWHHYAFTYNGASGTMYAFVDGRPTPTPNHVGPWPEVSSNLVLGARNGEYVWNGTMDELRIWNVQRTQSELQANLFNELAGNETGLIAYYNFNQGTAGGDNTDNATLYDAQTNGTAKNGTLTNFALNGNASNWVTSGGMMHYPEIDIVGNTVSITDGDDSPSDADHTDFGDVFIGSTFTRIYTLRNTGTKALTVSSVGSNNLLFTVGGFNTPSQIPINGSATFSVTFVPAAVGTQTSIITVNNDDCNEAVYDFKVSGMSTCAATAGITGTNSPVCVGSDAVFNLLGTAGAVVTYRINDGPNATVTLTGGIAAVTVTGGTAEQTLTLISVNDGTCTLNLSGSAKVTVKALPIVSAPAAAVCVGSTITLSPTAGGTWVSNAPAKATVTDAGLVTGVESGSVIFTFTETVSGCSNTTAAVTVNALPIAVVSSGGTVCADEPLPNVLITLTGKAPWNLTYVKNGTSTSVTNITNSPYTITGAAVGTYTVTALSDDNCTRTSMTGSADVIVKPLPVLTAGTVTHPTTCAGTNGSIAFTTANVPDGNYTLTYTGTGSPKTVAVSANAFTLSGLSAGVYSHFSLTYNNCTGIETTSKSLNDPSAPILSITSAANPTTCGGNEGSIAFTVTNIANGTYALTYTGTGSPKNVAVSAGIFTLNGLVAGTYADFSITSLGCTGTLSVSRTLNAPAAPELTAGTVTHPTTCAGTNGSITFTTANVPDGNYTLTYTGTGSPKTVAVSANAFTLSGLSAGLYSQFSVTRVGCTGNDISIKTLADPNPPTATIAGSIEVCQNAATPDITLAGALGTAPYTFTYRINNGPELTATTVSGSAVTLSQATGAAAGFTYSLVSVQDAKGCSQSQNGSAVITVNLLPVLTFTGPNPVCQGQPSTLATASAGTWMANAPSVATIGSDGTITTLEAGNATFMFTASGTGCPATSGQLIVKPTPTSALTASKTDVCPNTQVTLDARCSIPTATVNWSPGGPTVIPAAAILPYVYKASCTADGCTGNETSVEIRTQRILVDMKDLGAGVLPRAVIGSVIDNMAPVNQINAPPNNRRWTFIANGCEASEAVVFKLSGPVNFSTIDNAGVYAMFANDEGGFYSLDHPNYGNGGSFSNGTYTLTVDLRTGDGVGGPFPKNRVATGGLLATRTLQFTVGSPQSIVGSRQVATDLENGFSVEVAPNPVSNTLHLKVNEAQGQQVDVNLVDAAGRQLLQRTFVPGTDRHQEEFELNEITSGMYFLKVKAGQKQTTLKVIKYK